MSSIEKNREVVLSVKDLKKTFRIGFLRRKVEAVRGVSFEVRDGEIFGLLGPNGAGKTTTIKSILRLILPDEGDIRIFGADINSREAAMRVGYMPENPYIYQYLKPAEFLDLCARLFGMNRQERQTRIDELLTKVGLDHARNRPIGKFSKGMMQRVGLAQSLINDPELLILDEPMSGLDPVGRKQVRDILLEQKALGKTLLFTSHILSDVEMLCDRVTILKMGKKIAEGQIDELLHRDDRHHEVLIGNASDSLRNALASFGELEARDDNLVVHIKGDINDCLSVVLREGGEVKGVSPHRESLENLFMEEAASNV